MRHSELNFKFELKQESDALDIGDLDSQASLAVRFLLLLMH